MLARSLNERLMTQPFGMFVRVQFQKIMKTVSA